MNREVAAPRPGIGPQPPGRPAVVALRRPVGQTTYGALADTLRARIVAGEWPPGSALPAEQTLAGEHGVALGTLRQALSVLAQAGLVERRHGRGTFVKSALGGASMLRFFRFGDGTEVPASRILERREAPLPPEAAASLGVAPRSEGLRLRRVRALGGQPVLHEELWLPMPRFAALAGDDPSGWGDLLYPMFAARCGVHVHRALDTVAFGSLPAAAARALALPAGHPCVVVTRRAFDLAGRCVEHRVTRGDAHAFHYSVTLT